MSETIYRDTNWMALKTAISSGSNEEKRNALIQIKDAVIGSNRQKGLVISQDLVPYILNICTTEDDAGEKIDALIILGSLAKGSDQQVEVLIKNFNVIPTLVEKIILKDSDKKCIEICLSTLQTIYEKSSISANLFLTNSCNLGHFLNLASPESSFKTQICVTSILASLCQTYDDQIRLLHAGTIHILARMICFDNQYIQIPALRCLCCMCFSNRSVTDNICVTSYKGRSLTDILSSLLSRLFPVEIQLAAARCLTYIYRSGTLLANDHRILHKTLPALTRLCSDHFEQAVRSDAANTLAYLIEIDSELQRTAAISNHLLKSLSQLIPSNQPTTKQAALRSFASLAANDEVIRKRIVESNGFIDAIQSGLHDPDTQVRLAAVRCLHSLSRSVQQLRTTFQDNMVWEPLNTIISYPLSTDFLVAVTSTICNLMLEFSPSKKPMLEQGIIAKLCQFTDHPELSVRLNSTWALMNMSFQANYSLKKDIINKLGSEKIFKLIFDSEATIVIKALGLVRNLLSRPKNMDGTLNIVQVLEALNIILESSHSVDIKEQALCIIGNIAAGAHNGEFIINDTKIMGRLGEYVFHSDNKLQTGALYVISNILHVNETWSEEQRMRFKKLTLIRNIQELNQKTKGNNFLCEDFTRRMLMQVVGQCKKIFPDISI